VQYAAKSRSDYVEELQLRRPHPCKVKVRFICRREREELRAKCLRPATGPLAAIVDDQVDVDKYRRLLCKAAVAGWVNMTPGFLDSLVEFADDSPRPKTGKDGTIPFDSELLEFVLDNAHESYFENPILEMAERMLQGKALAEAQKKSASAS